MKHAAAILAVARAHGTTVAVEWSGRSPGYVRDLRKIHDGYDRGRGHPSAAEIAMRAPRPDCECPRCVAVFKVERFMALGYSLGAIARLLGLPVADVRTRAAEIRQRKRPTWVAAA